MRSRWFLTSAAVALTACGGTSVPTPPPVIHGAPTGYLLRVDDLISPDFSFDIAPHSVSVGGLASASALSASQLASAGWSSAAAEDLFRNDAELATLNGPAQVADTVEEYATAAGAATVYALDVSHLDAVHGASAVSTGALGDAAHATTRTAVDAGVAVVEITVEWRVDNLLSVLVVRGRDGAVRMDDALLLAHRQTVRELGLATPSPGGVPGA